MQGHPSGEHRARPTAARTEATNQTRPADLIINMAQSTDDLLKLRDHLVWRQVGDEVMVLDTDTSQYLSVNSSGAVLWPLLTDGCRREDLERALVEHFDVDDETARADTERFLASLKEIQAFEVSPAP